MAANPSTASANPYTLSELGMVDAPPEQAFDNLTALASEVLGAPVSLVSIVEFENDRQFFKSICGLPEPWATRRQTPLSHSFCQHVVLEDAPLAIEDAREHPLVKSNGAIADLGVVAYLGTPIHGLDGAPIGALCAIDSKPHAWQDADIRTMERLAACVTDAVALRAALLTSEDLRGEQRDFTYAISHDLKAPANTIQMILGELVELVGDGSPEEMSELFDLGIETVERMGTTVEEVLTYSRVVGEANGRDDVDLGKLVTTILSDLRSDIAAAGAIIDVGEMPSIRARALQIRILVQNLVSNAVKFRAPGRAPRIAISASQDPAGSGTTTIRVVDNGIGISIEHRSRVFRMFQRLHARDEYPGTGLGLTLCARIASSHGGRIEIRSPNGCGTEFVVTLKETNA